MLPKIRTASHFPSWSQTICSRMAAASPVSPPYHTSRCRVEERLKVSSLRFSTAIHSSVCGAGFAWLLGLGFGFAFAFPFALGIGLGLAAGLLRGISPRWDPFRGSLGLVSTFLLFELFCSARSPLRVLQKKGILPKKERVHKLEELGFEVCLLWFVLCLFLLLHTWLPNCFPRFFFFGFFSPLPLPLPPLPLPCLGVSCLAPLAT